MKHPRTFLLLVSAALALFAGCQTTASAPRPDDGRVTVAFQQPADFTDFKDSFVGTDKGREAYMQMVRDFVDRRARYSLAEGQKLSVTFLDIDMAGDFLPAMSRGRSDLRVIKDIYPPRIRLQFTLTDAAGTVLKQGERKLEDSAFLMRLPIGRHEELKYEFELLRDWLQKELR